MYNFFIPSAMTVILVITIIFIWDKNQNLTKVYIKHYFQRHIFIGEIKMISLAHFAHQNVKVVLPVFFQSLVFFS